MKRLIIANLSALLLLSCGAKEAPKKNPSKPTVEAPKSTAAAPVTKPTSAVASAPSLAPTIPALDHITMLTETNGWARSGEKILTTSDGGAHWSELTLQGIPKGAVLSAVFFLDATHICLNASASEEQTNQSIVWSSTDGGKTWVSATIDIKELNDGGTVTTTLHFLDTMHGWIGFTTYPGMNQHNGRIFGTKDGGKTWTKLSDATSDAISFEDEKNGALIGITTPLIPPQSIEITNDGGKTWKTAEFPKPGKYTEEDLAPFLGVRLPSVTDPKIGTVITQAENQVIVYATEDSGKTWSVQADGPIIEGAEPFVAIAPKGAIWLASMKDKAVQFQLSSDHGKTWTTNTAETGLTEKQRTAFEQGAVTIVAVSDKEALLSLTDPEGKTGTLLKTKDGGKTWAAPK